MHPVERSTRLSDWCDARMRLYANCAGDGGQAQCGGGGGGEAAESKVTASRYDDMRKLVGPGARTVLIGILQYSRSHLRGSHKHRNRKFVTSVLVHRSRPALLLGIKVLVPSGVRSTRQCHPRASEHPAPPPLLASRWRCSCCWVHPRAPSLPQQQTPDQV